MTRFQQADFAGSRMLYLYGSSLTGKTTFLRWLVNKTSPHCLLLSAGQIAKDISADTYRRFQFGRIEGLPTQRESMIDQDTLWSEIGTTPFLMIDDLLSWPMEPKHVVVIERILTLRSQQQVSTIVAGQHAPNEIGGNLGLQVAAILHKGVACHMQKVWPQHAGQRIAVAS